MEEGGGGSVCVNMGVIKADLFAAAYQEMFPQTTPPTKKKQKLPGNCFLEKIEFCFFKRKKIRHVLIHNPLSFHCDN